ncbi:MAG: hypothetical protein JEZ00_20680 [Anaerolineaceae bacterium]|nr:hypothetical protein [Anaerolineaceae bacterium]
MSVENNKCVQWLLESEHPSIRLLTKIKILNQTPHERDIKALTAEHSPIWEIMNQLKENKYWMHEKHFYSPKFFSSHWSLLMLHEYACPADYPRLQAACLHLLEKSHTKWLLPVQQKNNNDHELACFFANVLRYAYAFELGEHPHTQAILKFLSQDKSGKQWCCKHNQHMPCLWGAIRTLWAYGLIPQQDRSMQVQQSIQSALDMILNCAEMLTSTSRSPSPKEHTLWKKTGFPLYYQADRLFTLRVLQEHKQLNHEKLQPVLLWLQSRRRKNGHWRGSNPYRTRSWPYGIESEEIDRWVSLHSLSVLMDAGLESL